LINQNAKGITMKTLCAALLSGLIALGAAGSAAADTRVAVRVGAPVQYAPPPPPVYYVERGAYVEPGWRERQDWRARREHEWRREQWLRREEWRREQWRREQWRREHRHHEHWGD
jgi:hypothetical protein